MDLIYFLIDFILHIDVHLAELVAEYGVWVYAILFLILFCETGLVVTPFLPGDSLLFVAGALASLETNDLNVHMMVVLMLIAAIVGDAVNYTIGRLFGEKLFSNPNSKIFRRSYLDKTHQFYEKHGGKTIILARFVPIVRTFAPFVAGMGHMSYRHFAAYNVIGALLWVLLFTYAGYFFGTLPFLQNVTFYHENLEEDVTKQPWAKNGFDKVLLDPARAGAAGVMQQIIKLEPIRIVYVSCNPATLARDSEALLKAGYTIARLAMLDMFPHTGHLESMVLFSRVK